MIFAKCLHRAEQIIAFINPLMQISVYAGYVICIDVWSLEMIIKTNGTSLDVGQLSTLMTMVSKSWFP